MSFMVHGIVTEWMYFVDVAQSEKSCNTCVDLRRENEKLRQENENLKAAIAAMNSKNAYCENLYSLTNVYV